MPLRAGGSSRERSTFVIAFASKRGPDDMDPATLCCGFPVSISEVLPCSSEISLTSLRPCAVPLAANRGLNNIDRRTCRVIVQKETPPRDNEVPVPWSSRAAPRFQKRSTAFHPFASSAHLAPKSTFARRGPCGLWGFAEAAVDVAVVANRGV
jgi:hypothetical protein